uniref:Uncharacterized protein n=1 Tax=Felis catus TaxID=9685 RepID=A0ABI7XYK7_FELCA
MASRHRKRYSTSLIIREIQIKTTMRYHLTLVRVAKTNNSGNNRFWQGCGEREEHSCTVGGNANWCSHSGKQYGGSSKNFKVELSYDPAIALLGIYPKDTKMLVQKGTCTPMFTTVLSTIAKLWKKPKYPLTDEWIKKMWCIYTMDFTQQSKRMKCCHLQQHGWNWRVLC